MSHKDAPLIPFGIKESYKPADYEVCDKCNFKPKDRQKIFEYQKHPLLDDYVPPTIPEVMAPRKEFDFKDFPMNAPGPEGQKPAFHDKVQYADNALRETIQRFTYKKPYFVSYDTKAERQVGEHINGLLKGVVPLHIMSPVWTDQDNDHRNVEKYIKGWYEYNSRGIIRFVGMDGTNHPTNTRIQMYIKKKEGKTKNKIMLSFLQWASGWDKIPKIRSKSSNKGFYYIRAFNYNWSTSGGAGGNALKLGNRGPRHTRHEVGHVLGLGHACRLPRMDKEKSKLWPAYQDRFFSRGMKKEDKDKGYGKTNYGDPDSSFMAASGSPCASAPEFHRLGFSQPDESIFIRPGYKYRLRTCQAPEMLTQFGIVHIEPYTGDYIWFSNIRKKQTDPNSIFVHVTSANKQNGRAGVPVFNFERQVVKNVGDEYVDESGIVLRVTEIKDQYIDVIADFDANKAVDKKPPQIDISQEKVDANTVKVTAVVSNPNPPEYRPYLSRELFCSKCANKNKLVMDKVYVSGNTKKNSDVIINDQTVTLTYTVKRGNGAAQQAAAIHIFEATEKRFMVNFG